MEEQKLTEEEKSELRTVATDEQIEEMKRQIQEWTRQIKFRSPSTSDIKKLDKKKRIRKQIKQKKARDRKRNR